MDNQTVQQHDVAQRILAAANTLMAEVGVAHLSTHKIAKAAGVSVGTIYLYFKDKDDLLEKLVDFIFDQFQQAVEIELNSATPLFEQYRQIWLAYWQLMEQHPTIVQNIHQYESLPRFQSRLLSCLNQADVGWNKLVRFGQEAGVIAPLPPSVLHAMSFKPGRDLMYLQLLTGTPYSPAVLDEVIARTWKAITL